MKEKLKEKLKKNKKAIIVSFASLAVVALSIILFGWIGLWYCTLVGGIIGISLTGIKKHGLLKILSIILLLIVLLSNILPGRQDVINPTGIADVLVNYLSIVLNNFSFIVLFILAIGGFYGVLNKTPAYKKMLDSIVTKVKPLGKKFIYLIIILFALLASLTGMTIHLFIFVPLVVSIILLLGYDKLVAITSTVVSIIIGYIGGVFVTFLNPNTYTINTYEQLVGLENKFYNIFPKLLLLTSGIALTIYFVTKHIKNVENKKVKYDLTDTSELLVTEVKGNYKSIKTWPLIIILVLTLAILTIGNMPWNTLFEITAFSDFHNWLMDLGTEEFKIFPNIISKSLPALGEWNNTGNFMASYIYSSMLLIFMTIIVAITNKIKLNDALDNYLEGIKKMIPTAVLLTVAYTILVCSYNNGFLENIISNYGKFNYTISTLLALAGCIFNVDITWIIVGVFSPIIALITDEEIYASIAILLQGIYGIFSVVGPTSLILIIALTYFDIPYTTWLKYIWRFILALIILVVVVTVLVVLL